MTQKTMVKAFPVILSICAIAAMSGHFLSCGAAMRAPAQPPPQVYKETTALEYAPPPASAPVAADMEEMPAKKDAMPSVSPPQPPPPQQLAAAPGGPAKKPVPQLEPGAAPPAEKKKEAAKQPEPKEQVKPQPEAPAPEPREPVTVRYLSADDSNSAASPVVVRQLIRQGRYVQPALVRTYEFLNYYTFDYRPPLEKPIAIHASMRPAETPSAFSLQVAVRSQDRPISNLPPMRVLFLLDSSGSMAGQPIELGKKLISSFAGKLRPGDALSLVTVNRTAKTVLAAHPIDGKSLSWLDQALSSINANDVTNLEKGVEEAFDTAGKAYDAKALNRVILISDGADNTSANAIETISRAAQDSDRQGIYLAGIGVGEGFCDQLMDAFTDKGRGAYLFVDGEKEIGRVLEDSRFVASFDLAVKDVRLRMEMPAGWKITEFHGEQVSAKAEEVTPQYLSPNDQMIYHLVVSTDRPVEKVKEQVFAFEAEYTLIGGKPDKIRAEAKVGDLLAGAKEITKGDAIVAFAEMLKKVEVPLTDKKEKNLEELARAEKIVSAAAAEIGDDELKNELLPLLSRYRRTLESGEQLAGARDGDNDSIEAALGISANETCKASVDGPATDTAIKTLSRLLYSTRLVPTEGYKFLALASGPVGNPNPSGSGQLSGQTFPHPFKSMSVYDRHAVKLECKAPANAKSLSFDFNFFSAEYPGFVNKNYNDTFLAMIEAPSTNGGRPANIAFDADNQSIEVDNNYFQQPFHPVPNVGTGFDAHGSTGWLRTHWPVKGGEEFSLTFSVHDEGDAVYDSLVLLDNFRFNDYEAVGTTDPLN